MKKSMFIAVAAIMMATADVKAQNKTNEADSIINYEINVNMNSLTRYLHLNEYQQDIMAYASEKFSNSVSHLKHASEEKRSKRLQNALRRNLGLARYTLDDKQYSQYLRIINITLINKGLNSLLINSDLAMNK